MAITSLVNHGIILGTVTNAGTTFASPLTISSTGTVDASTGKAVYATGAYYDLTLVNQGTIIAAAGYGVDLANGGYVDNAGGLIRGRRGVAIYNYAGSVTNTGTVVGTGTTAGDAGVRLEAGGSVANTGTGRIQGYAGVSVYTSAGVVTNAATIVGTGGGFSHNAAVNFTVGGSVGNAGLLQGYRGVEIYGAAGTITNSGTIEATGPSSSADAVYLKADGTVTNNGGLITGYYQAIDGGSAVTNSGTLTSVEKYAGWTVRLVGLGGSVENQTGGLIEGRAAIGIFGGAGTVTNAGAILGTNSNAVALYAGGSIGNTGTGLIEGYRGVYIGVAVGTVTNSATIVGTSGVGVRLGAGGTVVDAGTISGSGTAISFGGTGGNLLVLDPGYVLSGSVVVAGTANALALAGTAAGTLSGIGSQFTNFSTVTVDAGAVWTLGGSNTLGSGVTLTDLGKLTITGSLTGAGSLVVDPAILANSGYLGLTVTLSGGGYLDNTATGTISNAGVAIFGTVGGATVVNAGTIVGTGTVEHDVMLDAGGSFGNSGLITGAGGVFIDGGIGTVANSGSITATSTNLDSVILENGGYVSNAASASIVSAADGVAFNGTASGTLVNFGRIAATEPGHIGLAGVALYDGGTITNAAAASIVGGYRGVVIANAAGTVINDGSIRGGVLGTGTTFGAYGVWLIDGGSVTNGASASIIGYKNGIVVSNAAGTVVNNGSIVGNSTAGDYSTFGGSVTNNVGASITGGDHGVDITGAAGTVVNRGDITGNVFYGVLLNDGGTVSNAASAAIAGYKYGVNIKGRFGTVINSGTISGVAPKTGGGVSLAAGGTVVDSGTISGAGGVAVDFGGAGGNRLVLDPGYKFVGSIVVAGTANALELAGTAAGTLSGIGTSFTNFGTVTVDANGNWTLNGSNTLASGVTLSDLGNLTIAGTLTGAGSLIVDPASLANSGYLGLTVTLSGGGYFDNAASGTITAAGTAVFGAGGAATVVNAGKIDGTAFGAVGVSFAAGGYVGNGASAGLIEGYQYGVRIAGTLGSVVNAGSIEGSGPLASFGIGLYAGGSIDNTGLIAGYAQGVRIQNVTGTVINLGTITSGQGGVVIVNVAGTVDNSGAILATAAGYGDNGVYLTAGGSIGNTGGLIEGYDGVVVKGAAGTLTNAATIAGTGTSGYGAGLAAGGSVGNTGTALIAGATAVKISGAAGAVSNAATIAGTIGAGIYLAAGGSVSNTGTGLIQGYRGISIKSAAGTVSNAATIIGTGTHGIGSGTGGNYGRGVYLYAGGSLDNSGLIRGYGGIYAYTGAGTVTNSGTIVGVGSFGYGIALRNGGSLDNTGGRIEGFAGVEVGAAGTVANAATIIGTGGFGVGLFSVVAGGALVDNSGLIEGSTDGVYIPNAADTLTNSGTIASTGLTGLGVDLAAGGTVVDSGTIGGLGAAVRFGGRGGNLLALERGFVLSGSVVGSASASNTVELLGSSGAVTADYNGLALSNFGTIAFGAASGNSEIWKITNDATLPGTIAGFVNIHDTIDLTGFAGGTVLNNGTLNGSEQLVVSNGSGTVTLQLDPTGPYTGLVWQASPDTGGTGTDLTPVCYCRGTRILTPAGEVAVEELAIDDMVVTISGAAKPVKWIGRRAYDGRFVAGNRAMLPVRIAAGALAAGVPARDLFVSPGHALYLDGLLVRAEHLVNGATIVQEERVERLEYFHIELEAHDIIFADGAAAESYIDCGNRAKFHNAADFSLLYPDDDRPRWQYCAPLVEWESVEADAIRAALLERAAALGHRLDLDPDLHLVVDGAVIPPAAVEGQIYRFALSAGSIAVSVGSRSVAPAEVEAAARDLRRLGVPIERVVLSDADLRIEAAHGHAGLADGFHADEPTHRWTDGLAPLPDNWLRAFPGALTLEVHLFPSGLPYRLPPPASACAAA